MGRVTGRRHRRHLTDDQKSAVAFDMIPMKQAEAKERQRAAGGDRGNQYTGGKVAVVTDCTQPPDRAPTTRKIVADAVGISERKVQDIITIAKTAPENQQTQELADEISDCPDLGSSPIETKLGRGGGTFVTKELVYAYAMWISPAFNLKVIRAYDAPATCPLNSAKVQIFENTFHPCKRFR